MDFFPLNSGFQFELQAKVWQIELALLLEAPIIEEAKVKENKSLNLSLLLKENSSLWVL